MTHLLVCMGAAFMWAVVEAWFPCQSDQVSVIFENARRSSELSGIARLFVVCIQLTILAAPLYIPLYGAWWFASDGSDHLHGIRQKLEFLYLAVVGINIGLRGYATWISTTIQLICGATALVGIGSFLAWIYE